MRRVAWILIVMVTLAVPRSSAYGKTPYDATYTEIDSQGTHQNRPVITRMISDGKGHLRTEINHPFAGKMTAITDFTNMSQMSLSAQTKTAIESRFDLKDYPGPPDVASLKKRSAKALGPRKVAGRSCHGFSYTEQKEGRVVNTELWMDDAAGIFVESISSSPIYAGKVAKSTMTLTSLSLTTPAPDLFKLPPDYKVINHFAPQKQK